MPSGWRQIIAGVAALAAVGGFLFMVLGPFFGEGRTPGGDEPFRPDILLITVDTLRADHLGCYGHTVAETPAIDAIARRSIVFHQAYTTIPRTTPGIGSLMTGLWPHRHGSREVHDPIGELPTMASALRGAGYWTIGVTANGAAGERQRLDQGFDRFGNTDFSDAEKVHEWLFPHLEVAPQDSPLFLWVHYYEPHFDYRPAPDWKGNAFGKPCRETFNRHGHSLGLYFSNAGGHAVRVVDECRIMYDGEVARVDAAIAEFLDRYRELRPGRTELLIFTADHGENFGEDGLYFEHGPNVHNASTRVPLLLSLPDVRARDDHEPISLEDVLPTLLDYLEIERAEMHVDGRSLLCRLRSGDSERCQDARPHVYLESASSLSLKNFTTLHSGRAQHLHCLNDVRYSLCQKPGEPATLHDHVIDPHLETDLSKTHPDVYQRLQGYRRLWKPEEIRERAILDGAFKLVRYPLLAGGYEERVFRIDEDPYSSRDVMDSVPRARLAQMRRDLDAWTSELPDPKPREARDDQTIEQLKALGYVE
jgi:arylsulfatase